MKTAAEVMALILKMQRQFIFLIVVLTIGLGAVACLGFMQIRTLSQMIGMRAEFSVGLSQNVDLLSKRLEVAHQKLELLEQKLKERKATPIAQGDETVVERSSMRVEQVDELVLEDKHWPASPGGGVL